MCLYSVHALVRDIYQTIEFFYTMHLPACCIEHKLLEAECLGFDLLPPFSMFLRHCCLAEASEVFFFPGPHHHDRGLYPMFS